MTLLSTPGGNRLQPWTVNIQYTLYYATVDTHSRSIHHTVDIVTTTWYYYPVGDISSTVKRGNAFNSVFTLFLSSCTPRNRGRPRLEVCPLLEDVLKAITDTAVTLNQRISFVLNTHLFLFWLQRYKLIQWCSIQHLIHSKVLLLGPCRRINILIYSFISFCCVSYLWHRLDNAGKPKYVSKGVMYTFHKWSVEHVLFSGTVQYSVSPWVQVPLLPMGLCPWASCGIYSINCLVDRAM